MAQFARPASDISSGNWTPSTGTTLWETLDDNSDSDYVSSGNATDTFEVKLSTVSDPLQNGTHTVRWTERVLNGGGGPERYDAYLYESTTLIATLTSSAVLTDNTFTAASYNLTTAEQDAISDWTDLRVRFVFSTGASGEVMEVSWVEFEVPDVFVAPTVNASGYRFTDSDSTIASPSWQAAANTNVTLPRGKTFQLWVEIEETAGGSFSDQIELAWQKNGTGGYTTLAGRPYSSATGSMPAIHGAESFSYANDDAISSNPISQSVETFTNGVGVESTAESDVHSSTRTLSNQCTVLAFTIRIPSLYGTAASPGTNNKNDYYDFQVRKDDGTALNSTITARVTLGDGAGHIGGCPAETQGSKFGPFQDVNGNLYYITERSEVDNHMCMMKSTDDGINWVYQDMDADSIDLEVVDTIQLSDTIHIFHDEGGSVRHIPYYLSNHGTTPDTFGTSTQVVASKTENDQGVGVGYRTGTADFVVFYRNGTTSEVIEYVIGTPGSWGTASTLDSTNTINYGPHVVKGADSDVLHIFYTTEETVPNTIRHRSMLANNTLTASEVVYSDAYDGGSGWQWAITGAISWMSGSNDKVAVAVRDDSDNYLYFVSITDDGTPATPVLIDNVTVDNDPGFMTSRAPVARLTVDSNGVIYCLFGDLTDNDLYIYYSEDDGATWTDQTTPIEVQDGINAEFVIAEAHSLSGTENVCYIYAADYGGFDDWVYFDTYAAVGSVTFTKTGAGVSILSASGDSTKEYIESGSGTSVLVGSGVSQVEFIKAGLATSELTGSGVSQWEAIKLGTGALIGIGSGPSEVTTPAVTYEDTGIGISPASAYGTKVVEWVKSGAATSILAGSGTKLIEYVKEGAGVSPLLGTSADFTEWVKLGATASELIGSGASVTEYNKAGSGLIEVVGTGSKIREIETRTGAGVSILSSAGTSSLEATIEKTGAATSILTATSASQVDYVKTGNGLSELTGLGLRNYEFSEAGDAVSESIGSGSSVVEFIKLSGATGVLVGSGAKTKETSKVGSGTSILVGSGSSILASTYSKSGIAISELSGSTELDIETPASPQYGRPSSDTAAGSWTTTPLWSKVDDDLQSQASGDGVVITSDAVGNNGNTTNADLAISSLSDPTSSVNHTIRVRWNNGGEGGSGRDVNGYVELWQGTPGTGTLIATLGPILLTGSPNTEQQNIYTLTGTETDNITNYSTLQFRIYGIGSGGGTARSLVVESVELQVPSTTADVITYIRHNTARSELAGSGTNSVTVSGTTYTDTGEGVSVLAGAGTKSIEWVKAGVAISILTGSGVQNVEYVKSGSGTSTLSGTGLRNYEYARAGTGISVLASTSADFTEWVKLGAGVLLAVGSGVKDIEWVKAGAASLITVGSASAFVEYAKAGSATSELTSSGISEVNISIEKTGSGTSTLIASGTGVVEYIKTGQAVSELTGSGLRNLEYAEAATGVVEPVGSGLRNTEYIETGFTTSELSGAGAGVIEYIKLGSSTSELIGSGTNTLEAAIEKTGAAVSVLTGLGAGVLEHVKFGSGVSVSTGNGTGIIEYVKTGSGNSELIGSGSRNSEFTEAGVGVSGTVGSGVSQAEFLKTASAISTLVGSGIVTAQLTWVKTGTGRSEFIGDGQMDHQTTTGGSNLARPDADVTDGTWVKSSDGTNTDLYTMIDEASASDTDYITSGGGNTSLCEVGLPNITDPEVSTGHIIRWRAQRSVTNKNVTIVMRLMQGTTVIASQTQTNAALDTWTTFTYTLTGTEADNITNYNDLRIQFETTVNANPAEGQVSWVEFETSAQVTSVTFYRSGTGHAYGVASGSGVLELVRAGSSNLIGIASGSNDLEFAKFGAGVSELTGSGTKLTEYSESGAGTAATIGSGTSVTEFIKAGTGIVEAVGSGIGSKATEKTGTASSILSSSGLSQVEYIKTGATSSELIASGSSSVEFVKTGSATLVLTSYGTKVVEFVKAGTGISALIGSGVSEVGLEFTTYEDTGAGISILSAAGAKVVEFVKQGSATSELTSSGAKTYEIIKLGSGVSIFAGSGTYTIDFVKTATAISVLTGSGSRLVEYSETGTGIIIGVGSGSSEAAGIISKTGTAISELVGAGADIFESIDTGSATSILIGSGISQIEYVKTGASISELAGSGSKVIEFVSSGAGLAPLVGAGLRNAEYSETGAGIAEWVGSGLNSSEGVDSGTGVVVGTGSGAKIVEFVKVGAGAVIATAYGGRTVEWIEVGSVSSDFVGSGEKAYEIIKLGSSVSEITGSGTRILEYVEAGTGVLEGVAGEYVSARVLPGQLTRRNLVSIDRTNF